MKNGSILKAIIMFIVAAGCIAAFVVIQSFIKWIWLLIATVLIIAAFAQISLRKNYLRRICSSMYLYIKVMEPVYLDLDKESKKAVTNNKIRCRVVGETDNYLIYSYDTHASDASNISTNLLRRSKESPKEVVYLGYFIYAYCIFDNYIFTQKDDHIIRIDIETGKTYEHYWLGNGKVKIEGPDFSYYNPQDKLLSMRIEDRKMVCTIHRTKADSNVENDRLNYDTDYKLVVENDNGSFRATCYLSPMKEEKNTTERPGEIKSSEKTVKGIAPNESLPKRAVGLGRDESIIIKCEFESHPEDCPKDCDKCAIGIKTDGDTALAMGNFEEAIRQYKRAIFVEPRLSDAWCNLGNTYGMNSEYEKAIEAFDKAIEIDPKYGKALFGKAISLRNAGRPEEALALANKILEMYDDKQVEQFKNGLIGNGAREQKVTLSAQEAIDILTAKGMDIARNRRLLADDGKIHTIKALDMDESFASDVYRYCKKSLSSFGAAKVNSESVVMAFYGGIYSTLAYYESSDELTGVPVFAYLKDHVDLEKLEKAVETKLGIRGNETESEKVWNVIYPYARFTCDIAERVSPSSDAEKAVIDATDSAFILGMQLAMRQDEQH